MKLRQRKVEKELPQYGDIRLVSRFAWTPKEMQNEDVVWLESYWEKQIYRMAAGLVTSNGTHNDGWVTLYVYQ